MACMTHDCLRCGHGDCNNVSRQWCPKCGELMVSSFDEEPWQHADEYRSETDGEYMAWAEDDDPEEPA